MVSGASALVAFAMIALTMTGRAEAQQVVVEGQVPPPAQPPAQYAQPQPYYAPQPVYQQPVYAQPAQPAQPRTVTRPNIGLIVSGAVLLGVGWISNFIVGLPAGENFSSSIDSEWEAFRVTSLIPVAGPWIQLGVKPTDFSRDYWGPWLIINGLMQVSGLTMLIIGAATTRTETTTAAAEPGFQMAFVPQLGPDRAGGALIGTF